MKQTSYYQVVVEDGKWNGETLYLETAIRVPMKRKKPTVYFVGSMTDIFHETVSDAALDAIFWMMGLCSQHRFIVLTKRPERMREYLVSTDILEWSHFENPLPNVILGVTAENQEQADARIPVLLDTPAAARFVSIEPMLGLVDLTAVMGNRFGEIWNTLDTEWDERACKNGNSLDWVICGGESGPGARPMHPDWARSIKGQCLRAGVPFFFKQWGAWGPVHWRKATHLFGASGEMIPYGSCVESGEKWKPFALIGKKKAGNVLDEQTWTQFPEILEEM